MKLCSDSATKTIVNDIIIIINVVFVMKIVVVFDTHGKEIMVALEESLSSIFKCHHFQ